LPARRKLIECRHAFSLFALGADFGLLREFVWNARGLLGRKLHGLLHPRRTLRRRDRTQCLRALGLQL
jgi:hypothetical protein